MDAITAELTNLATGSHAAGDSLAATICCDAIQEITRLRAMLDERTLQHKVQLDNAVRLLAEVTAHRDMAGDNYWAWQGDEEDHIESLVCPVLIPARQLQAILDKSEALVSSCAELGAGVERLNADLAAGKYRESAVCGYCSCSGSLLLERAEKAEADAARLDWLLLHCIPFDSGRHRPLIETRNGIDGAMAVEADRSEETT